MCVVVLFRRGKGTGIESDRMDITGVRDDGEDIFNKKSRDMLLVAFPAECHNMGWNGGGE